jgi:hypothetical protein
MKAMNRRAEIVVRMAPASVIGFRNTLMGGSTWGSFKGRALLSKVGRRLPTSTRP